MSKEPKFNIKACNDYIAAKVEDFQIEISSNNYARNEVDGTILNFSERESSVILMKKFVIEAEKEGEKDKHDFLTWLNKRKQFWKGSQYTTITKISNLIEKSSGEDREKLEVKKTQFMNFFHYNYDLIGMMEKDVLNGYSFINDFMGGKMENEEKEEDKMHLMKDGKYVMPLFKWLNETGFNKRMKEKFGAVMNPIHDFEKLKVIRLELYEEEKIEFEKERKFNELQTSRFEYNLHYLAWLKHELDVIAQWTSVKYPNGQTKGKPSTSTQIELLKYKYFVELEMEEAEKNIGTPDIKGKKAETEKEGKKDPVKFSDIFVKQDWKKFITALEICDPKLLNTEWEFIGRPRSHKGVICSWIKYLQSKGEINAKINRSQLATVLNNEIKNLDIGKDGKTFTNFSALFDSDFKDNLINLSK